MDVEEKAEELAIPDAAGEAAIIDCLKPGSGLNIV